LFPSYEAGSHHIVCRQCCSHGRHISTVENWGNKYQDGR